MAAHEISEKLGKELLDRIQKVDRFCCDMAKKGQTAKWCVDSDWMYAACECEVLRQHILYHLKLNKDANSVEKPSCEEVESYNI